MDIFQHFSCYTELPIKMEQVREYIYLKQLVDRILFHPVDRDPTILKGMLYTTKDKPPYFTGERITANIAYSINLSTSFQRLVICKELLHILDNGNLVVNVREDADRLISEITLPSSVSIDWANHHAGTNSDKTTELLALAILFPRDSITELRPLFEADKIGIEEIAALTLIPESYIPLTLSDVWMDFLNTFEK